MSLRSLALAAALAVVVPAASASAAPPSVHLEVQDVVFTATPDTVTSQAIATATATAAAPSLLAAVVSSAEMWSQLGGIAIQYLAVPIFAALGLGLAALVAKGFQLLSAKTTGTIAGNAVSMAEHVIGAVIEGVFAKLKPQLAEAVADGKVTSEELTGLRDAALAEVKEILKKQGLGALEKAFGSGAGAYLENKVSAAVAQRVADAQGAASP